MLTPGQLAIVDSSERLCIPLSILSVVEWWTKKSQEVTAELVHAGLIRIYLPKDIVPILENTNHDLSTNLDDESFLKLAINADRYRSLKLYADGRLRLTKEVAHILEFNPGEKPTFFVQPFPKGLEILSLSLRLERLKSISPNITLLRDGIFKSLDDE